MDRARARENFSCFTFMEDFVMSFNIIPERLSCYGLPSTSAGQ
jgi:hypothetical protein